MTGRTTFHLEGDVRCDVTEVLGLLHEGRVAEVLSLYRGPFLARNRSPFATQIRMQLERGLVRCAVDCADPETIERVCRVCRVVEDAGLRAELTRRRCGGGKSVLPGRPRPVALEAVG